jgi:hypothetical protein
MNLKEKFWKKEFAATTYGKAYVLWAKENGMNFHTRVQPMPKSIPRSPEIDLSAQSNVK